MLTLQSEIYMGNVVIVVVLAVILFFAGKETVKHFKGEGACCGGGSGEGTKARRKKLHGTVICKYVILIEGMHCKNCSFRIEQKINALDGVSGRVNLRKKEAVVQSLRPLDAEEVSKIIVSLGYEVCGIKSL